MGQHGATSDFVENVEVEQMHDPEAEHHSSDLHAGFFQHASGIGWAHTVADIESNESEVDEIKPDDEEVVHRVGEFFVPAETVHEEDASVSMQGFGHPERQRNADRQIAQMCEQDEVHILWADCAAEDNMPINKTDATDISVKTEI